MHTPAVPTSQAQQSAMDLRMALSKQICGDDDALDLARALVNFRDARVAVVPLDRELGRVPVAAVYLDGLVGHAGGHFARVELRHRALGAMSHLGVFHLRGSP